MDKPVIFALTPRASRWNHRFLVPPNAPWSRDKLSRLAESVQKMPEGEDYISIQREVVQESTGRKGMELLVCQDRRLQSMASGARDQLKTVLAGYATTLGGLVRDTIDWGQVGDGLVLERSELLEWQKETDRLVSRETTEGRSDRPGSDSGSHGWVIAVIVGSIFLLLIGLLGWQFFPVHRPGSRNQRRENKGRKERTGLSTERLMELAGVIGVAREGSRENIAKAVATRLGQLYEVVSESKRREGLDRTSAGVGKNEETELAYVQDIDRWIRLLYRHGFRTKATETLTLDVLIGDDGVQEGLRNLFPPGRNGPDPCGLLWRENDNYVEELRKVDPIAFRKIIDALAAIGEEGASLQEDKVYGGFVKAVRILNLHHAEQNEPARRFYVRSDLESAKVLERLLQGISFVELVSEHDRRLPLTESLKQIAVEFERDGHWAREVLEAELKRRDRRKEIGAAKSFELLIAFARSCKLAVSREDAAGEVPADK